MLSVAWIEGISSCVAAGVQGGVGSLESGTGHIEEMYRASLRRGAGLDEEQ